MWRHAHGSSETSALLSNGRRAATTEDAQQHSIAPSRRPIVAIKLWVIFLLLQNNNNDWQTNLIYKRTQVQILVLRYLLFFWFTNSFFRTNIVQWDGISLNHLVPEGREGRWRQHGHHHHHQLFLKRPFLPRSARVRRLPRYEASPHIPEHWLFRVQTTLIRVIFYTFSPCLPAHTSHPCYHHISTGRHPIIGHDVG